MLNPLILTISSIICATQANKFLAGIKSSVDVSVLDEAKEVYFESILNLVRNHTIRSLYTREKDYCENNTFGFIHDPEEGGYQL
jgi:hypothetical protein